MFNQKIDITSMAPKFPENRAQRRNSPQYEQRKREPYNKAKLREVEA